MRLGIPYYEEKFPPSEYDNVVNSQNKDTVDAINALAEKMNTTYNNQENFDEEAFLDDLNTMFRLVYGSKAPHHSIEYIREQQEQWEYVLNS
jgi:hypothetical protein